MTIERGLLMNSISRLADRCRSMRDLKQIHAQVATNPLLSPPHTAAAAKTFLLSRLLLFSATSPLGSLLHAAALFRDIPDPNLFMYNTMIRAYSCSSGSSPHTSLGLYRQMLSRSLLPDHLTFPVLLKQCSKHQDLWSGRAVHSHTHKLGFGADVFIQNAVISLYCACGWASHAMKVFDEMPTRDIVTWNSILIGCLRCGELDFALDFFGKMEVRNIRTWNSIITGFVQAGHPKEALAFFHDMLRDGQVKPDKITLASVVSSCASLGALDEGIWVHRYLKTNNLELDTAMGTALVDMYGKCGGMERAIEVFQEMPKKDVLAWTAMISAYAVNGHGEEAFDLMADMENCRMRPNHVTFGALLSACAHGGLLEKGWWCFQVMRHVYFIDPSPQHYACMVDLLGRAGQFDKALELIRSMPMEPDAYVWGALLGGCRMHGNIELGEVVAMYLIDRDPSNEAFYVILSDLYAKTMRFAEVNKIRAFMVEHGIRKTSPGCSRIEVDGRVVEFSVNGALGVSQEEIAAVLSMITKELKLAGYTPIIN